MINGNPRTAMIAAFCWAFAAMAAKKVKTRLRLQPPRITRPAKGKNFCIGLPRKRQNNSRLSKLITNISNELKMSLAKYIIARAGNRIKIEHPRLAFLQETFSHSIDADE